MVGSGFGKTWDPVLERARIRIQFLKELGLGTMGTRAADPDPVSWFNPVLKKNSDTLLERARIRIQILKDLGSGSGFLRARIRILCFQKSVTGSGYSLVKRVQNL